jgi:hypothetical protein
MTYERVFVTMGLKQQKNPSLTIDIPSTAIAEENNTGRIDPKRSMVRIAEGSWNSVRRE